MSEPKPPHRGTIVMSASGLISLCSKVSDRLKEDGLYPDNYLDILGFLGKNGYQIVIPEMVSVEAANIIRNGFCINDAFGKSGKFATQPKLEPLLKDAARAAGSPLKNFTGISIATHTGPEEVEALLDRLNHHTNNQQELSKQPHAKKRAHPQNIIHTLSDNLWISEKTDFGDRAILSLLSKEPLAEPITVITNDVDLMRTIRDQFPDVCPLAVPNFVYSIGQSGVAHHAGFAKGLAGDALREDRWQGHAQYRPKNSNPSKPNAQFHPNIAKHSTLYGSLQVLANDLDRQPPPIPPEAVAQSTAPEVPSKQIAKFEAKFGNQRLAGGSNKSGPPSL